MLSDVVIAHITSAQRSVCCFCFPISLKVGWAIIAVHLLASPLSQSLLPETQLISPSLLSPSSFSLPCLQLNNRAQSDSTISPDMLIRPKVQQSNERADAQGTFDSPVMLDLMPFCHSHKSKYGSYT